MPLHGIVFAVETSMQGNAGPSEMRKATSQTH